MQIRVANLTRMRVQAREAEFNQVGIATDIVAKPRINAEFVKFHWRANIKVASGQSVYNGRSKKSRKFT
jgi:hypothetical protein